MKVDQQHIGPFFLDEDLWYTGKECPLANPGKRLLCYNHARGV